MGLVCLRILGIPHALGWRAYLSLGCEVGALYVEHLAVFVGSLAVGGHLWSSCTWIARVPCR